MSAVAYIKRGGSRKGLGLFIKTQIDDVGRLGLEAGHDRVVIGHGLAVDGLKAQDLSPEALEFFHESFGPGGIGLIYIGDYADFPVSALDTGLCHRVSPINRGKPLLEIKGISLFAGKIRGGHAAEKDPEVHVDFLAGPGRGGAEGAEYDRDLVHLYQPSHAPHAPGGFPPVVITDYFQLAALTLNQNARS